jgi:hypothetical protein
MRSTRPIVAVLALIAVIPAACAETAPDALPKNPKGQLVELARQNMMSAVDEAIKRVGYCLDLGKTTLVKPDAIAKIKLTFVESKIALLHLHHKAEDTCMAAAINDATVQITMFKTIEFETYGKNHPAPFTNSKDQFTPAELCCGNAELRLNSQLNYLGLSAEMRSALEAIPELKTPFNYFELAAHFNPPPSSAKP